MLIDEERNWEKIMEMARDNPDLNQLVHAVRSGEVTRNQGLGLSVIALAAKSQLLVDHLAREISMRPQPMLLIPKEPPALSGIDMAGEDLDLMGLLSLSPRHRALKGSVQRMCLLPGRVQIMVKDKFGGVVTGGFILALICAGVSAIPGLGFVLWGAVLGIIPFCLATIGALFYSLHGLFTGRK